MSQLGTALPLSFYRRTADRLAPDLLGKLLAVRGEDGVVRRGRIVEVEAYLGEADLACHASKGLTPRTRTLYGPPGTAYVYLAYGMHELFNVVAATQGDPHAVLVRAVELLDAPSADAPGNGRRARARGDGPGRLTLALGIDRRFDGADLTAPPVTLHEGAAPTEITVTPRVGVGYAGAWADAALRFVDATCRSVSRPPRSAIGRTVVNAPAPRTRRAACG